MKVRELKKFLEKVPDDTLVVLPSQDHSYRAVSSAGKGKAVIEGRRLSEYFGPDYVLEDCKVIDVFIVD
jgi:hypothetical protein